MSTSVYIYIRRSDLVDANACHEGLAMFDRIASARGKKEKIRLPWGPLSQCWLDADGRNFGTWLVTHGLAPCTSTSGVRGTSTSGDGGTSTSGYGGTSTSGVRGTSTSGVRGTSTSGDGGTSTSGDGGTIAIRYWDTKHDRYRLAVADVGLDGIKPNTAYVLDAEHRFVEKR